MSTLINIINDICPTLTADQSKSLIKRISDSQSADRGQGKAGKVTERTGTAKISLPKKGSLEQKATWSTSVGTSWEAPVTPSLKLEATIKAWEDGCKRGLFDNGALPPIHPSIREWIAKLIANL